MFKFLTFILALIGLTTQQSYQDDQVTQMPGWPKTSYNLYSGMLNADASGSRQLHYFFIESQSSPSNDDLVIWLNGGPGCSSLLGMIQENGPFQFTGDNDFFTNLEEYSWNKEANVLYIESPAGVGFSTNNDKNYVYSDDHTAEDIMYAYDQWIQRFESSDINLLGKKTWISGESYGGMYIPFFANAMLDYNEKQSKEYQINLQGFLIGNGAWILNWNFLLLFQINAYPQHNYFSPELREKWYQGCLGDNTDDCEDFLNSLNNVGNNTDTYQIYNYTYSYPKDTDPDENQYIFKQGDMLQRKSKDSIKKEFMTEDFISKHFTDAKEYMKNKNSEQKLKQNQNKKPERTWQSPEEIIQSYFNSTEVKEAMHVDKNINWQQCNMGINQAYQSAANSTHLYPRFFEQGLQILIFSGNTDAAVPFPYTWYCMNDLMENYDVDMEITDKWRQWGPQADQQVGGMVQTWSASKDSGSQFTFAMVRAAGHEVPMYQPASAYNMFYNFTHGMPI